MLTELKVCSYNYIYSLACKHFEVEIPFNPNTCFIAFSLFSFHGLVGQNERLYVSDNVIIKVLCVRKQDPALHLPYITLNLREDI